MTKRKVSNVAASVRQRLLNIIRETGGDSNLIWSRYAVERLLYRLSVSEHDSDFVLKGAMLFLAWTGQLHRPTVDLDLLGRGEDSAERLAQVFRDVCNVEVEPDGLVFDPDTVKVGLIREDQPYQGRRVALTALLGKSRIPVQVDVGFGDAVWPRARKLLCPTLLDLPAPRVRAYPYETVVAEKFHALVILGIANSRMKDFYDLYVLAHDFTFGGATLARAIKATFGRRNTDIPISDPLALTEEFGHDAVKTVQWNGFVRKAGLEGEAPELMEVISRLREFLLPVIKKVSAPESDAGKWEAGGPWK
ncbi:nucleotidyl transferase AbiEii/AbiGii toxin family protein [Candidatus Hydrogenedentota bacterium]